MTIAKRQWFDDQALLGALIDRIAQTSWWPLLQVIGKDAVAGTPIGDAEDTKRRLLGARGYWVLAQGGPRAAADLDESDAWIKLDMSPGYLGFGAGVRGAPLAKMKGAALSEMIDLVCAVRNEWTGSVLTHATATPTGTFTYDRLRPPRIATRPLHAIADIVDPSADDESRLIAEATPPEGAVRSERQGLVVLRCVDDPSDEDQVRAAAAAHERWMADVINAPVDDEWKPGDP